jgi:uncharacterized FlaG/YvyC family protein
MTFAIMPPADTAFAATKKVDQTLVSTPLSDNNTASATVSANALKPVTSADESTKTGQQKDDLQRRTEQKKRAEEQRAEDTSFTSNFDSETGQRVFQRVSNSNGYVLWQYPEEKMLELAREEHQQEGLFADFKV